MHSTGIDSRLLFLFYQLHQLVARLFFLFYTSLTTLCIEHLISRTLKEENAFSGCMSAHQPKRRKKREGSVYKSLEFHITKTEHISWKSNMRLK